MDCTPAPELAAVQPVRPDPAVRDVLYLHRRPAAGLVAEPAALVLLVYPDRIPSPVVVRQPAGGGGGGLHDEDALSEGCLKPMGKTCLSLC